MLCQAKHFGDTLWPWLDCTQIARGEKEKVLTASNCAT